jgi:hypothetical protein
MGIWQKREFPVLTVGNILETDTRRYGREQDESSNAKQKEFL